MVVEQRSAYRRLQQLEISGIGVQTGANAERECPLRLDMSDREAIGNRDPERTEIGREHLVEAERTVGGGAIHLGKPSNDCPGQVPENPQGPEVGEYPIDSIEIFAHVLQEEESSVEFGKVRRADETVEQGEVPADERALGCSAGQGDDSTLRSWNLLG